jgi:hypothetical protein
MRWACSKFALFAVIVLAAGVFVAAPPAHAAPTVDTEVLLLWRDKPDEQPTGQTRFFARVIGATEKPTGSVIVRLDDRAAETRGLKDPPAGDALAEDACDGEEHCVISNDVTLDVGLSPHYFRTDFVPAESNVTLKPSVDELGLARGVLDASNETSQDGDLVTYSFHLLIWPGTPQNRRPTSPIRFSDDQGHSTGDSPRQMNSDLKAEWTVSQSTGLVRTTATYPGGGDDIFLPFEASRNHSVEAKPDAPDNTSKPATTVRRTTTTARRSILRTPTTAALAPINPGPTTTIAGQTSTTLERFGDFTTISPSTTGQLSAASNNDDEGPPIAVVATTMLALAVLGGVAAFRRYRKGGIDWF